MALVVGFCSTQELVSVSSRQTIISLTSRQSAAIAIVITLPAACTHMMAIFPAVHQFNLRHSASVRYHVTEAPYRSCIICLLNIRNFSFRNCSTVDLGEISRAFLWETYGRKVRAAPECMQSTRVHQSKAPSWLAGARAGDFQPVTLWSNVVNHARAAFSLRPTRAG